MRVGQYHDAAQSNAEAAAIDEVYIAKYNIQGAYPMMYYSHNVHFLWAAASMEGRSKEALQAARKLVKVVSPDMVKQMPMAEFASPTLLFGLARFGRWEEILKEPAPPAELRYTTGIWHYVRGLALAATGKVDEAVQEQEQVTTIAKATPADQLIGLNAAANLLAIASHTLAGEIAARRGQTDEAVRLLGEAVKLQDALKYEEPPAWYYPVRQSLGAVLLAAGRAKEAEAVYREDLKQNPNNGWSLYGLAQSLHAQDEKKHATAVEERYRKAWTRADVKLTASRF
jgi:tetratricopeptide (TPR) repeat protein